MDGTVARVTRVVRTMVDDSEIAAYMVSSRGARLCPINPLT